MASNITAPDDWLDLLTLALDNLCKDRFLQGSEIGTREVTELLRRIKNARPESLESTGKRLVAHINAIVIKDDKKVTNPMLAGMCNEFQAKVASREFATDVEELASVCGMYLEKRNFISWLLMESLLKEILQSRKAAVRLEPNYEDNSITRISETEMQVVRYAAGYIVRKTMREDDKIAYVCATWIENDTPTEEHNTFLDYTRHMVDALDRGSLIKVTDNFFLMLVAMEKIMKQVMEKPSKHLFDKALEVLADSPQVISIWENLISTDVVQQDKKRTFDLLVKNYATLRLKSYANAYKFVLSKKENAKLQKSLRHSLE